MTLATLVNLCPLINRDLWRKALNAVVGGCSGKRGNFSRETDATRALRALNVATESIRVNQILPTTTTTTSAAQTFFAIRTTTWKTFLFSFWRHSNVACDDLGLLISATDARKYWNRLPSGYHRDILSLPIEWWLFEVANDVVYSWIPRCKWRLLELKL